MKCERCPSIASYIVMILGAIVLAWLTWFSGWAHGRNDTYLEAVKENHAHWEADKVTGRPFIEWNK